MKLWKKLLIVGAVLAGLALGLVGGALWFVNRYVQTPEFKALVQKSARAAVGTEVTIQDLHVYLFRGIELRGLAVANPAGFPGPLLTAQSFTLRYRLWPLLQRRVEVAAVILNAPTITLSRNAQGDWNYDQLGSKAATVAAKPAGTPAGVAPPAAGSHRMAIAISRVAVQNATIVMLVETNKELLRITNAGFDTAVDLVGTAVTGQGRVTIQTVNVANSLLVRNLAAPAQLSAGGLKLTPLTGKVAEGNLAGDVALNLAGPFQYTVNLQVKDASMVKLLEEAGVHRRVFSGGKLQLTAALTGTGGLPTLAGTGRAEIIGGTLLGMPLQELLAAVLQVPELREIKFDECRLEFSIATNVMQTPVIRLKSSLVQVTGQGSVALADYSVNHNLTLTLAKGVLDKVPKEIRSAFTEQADGSMAIDFRVWGPYDKPKTDLTERLLKSGVNQLLQKGLQRFFK